MDRTKTERAVVGLLLLAVVFLIGLFLGRGWQTNEVLQLPEARVVEPEVVTAAAEAAPEKIDINTATAAELETLPGIGPKLAERIIAWREANGPFLSTEELMAVQGIGEKTLSELEAHITAGATASQYQEVNK